MPIDPSQSIVDLTHHTLVTQAVSEGSSSIELYRNGPDTDERATAQANTVQMLKSIRAMTTAALHALGEG